MNKLEKKITYEHVLPITILIVFALLISMSTYFFYFSKQTYGHDAGIFAYVGMAMKEGRVLYTEVWENKGPLLYFINMLGIMLNYWHGIYWLELISLVITIIYAYKTALLFSTKWMAMIAAIFAMLPLTATLQGGNLAEEYALPFLMVAIFYVTKFFLQDKQLKWYEMSFVGICGGACLLLRANILAMFFAMFLVVIYVLLKEKEFKLMGKILLFSLSGCIFICLPFFLYLVFHHALFDCLHTAYIGILNDYLPLSKVEFMKNIYTMIKVMVPSGALFFCAVFIVAFITAIKKKAIKNQELKYILWFSFIGLWINLFANCLTGANHPHYFMTFIPLLVIPLIWLFNSIQHYLHESIDQAWVSHLIIFALCLFISFGAVISIPDQIINEFKDGSAPIALPSIIANYIVEHSEKDDTIQTFGYGPTVTAYYHANRLSASKYSYYSNGRFTDKAKSNFIQTILTDCAEKRPKIILFENSDMHKDFLSRLTDEQNETWQGLVNQDYTLQKVDFDCIIYQRKE